MTGERTTRAQLLVLGAVLALLALPAVLFPGTIATAASLAVATAPGREYLAAGRLGLVYGLVPIVSLSATTLVLAPGLLFAIGLGRSRSVAEWLVGGFVLSLVGVSVVSGVVQALGWPATRGSAYAGLLVGLALAGFVFAWRSVARRDVAWPLARPADRRLLVALVAFWGVTLLLLLPKLLWDSFNGDGAHAFESSRLLLRHALPFWPESAGPVAGFPGLTSMLFAFPNAWFLRLFGEVEYAVRVPFLLYVPVLACAVLELGGAGRAEEGDERRLRVAPLLLSLGAFTLAMAFSASYNAYSADIALPATQDTLLMIVYLGALRASVRRDWGWLALCIALTYSSLPSGVILIGFWLVARALVERPVPWRDLGVTAALLAGTVVLAALVPAVLARLGRAGPGGEYGAMAFLEYFAYLQFTDIRRVLYVAIPAGTFPVLACALWRRQDRVARALTLVTAAYFLFFFVQAHVSLHHFVPAMVLPMAVAVRLPTAGAGRRAPARWWLPLAAASVLLAWPWGRLGPHREGREVGAAVAVRIPGYDRSSSEVMRASTLLARVLPYDWDPAVPATYGGSPLVWNHYARQGTGPSAETNYLVQPAGDAPPAGWRLAGADSAGAVLYVRSDSILASHRRLRPPTPPGSRLLAVPRGILFHSVPLEGGPRIIDVARTLEGMGVDVESLLARLGARRRS